MSRPLRLMIYDRTCTGDLVPAFARRGGSGLMGRVRAGMGALFERVPGPGLSHAWAAGGGLYSLLRRLDDFKGFDDWESALRWVAEYPGDRPIRELQFWGHGKWGCANIGYAELGADAVETEHRHHAGLAAIRDRMKGQDALVWFRTCETFGAEAGHRFATDWSEFFDCRIAGHTYVIGPWQSGLHSLGPGQTPDWSTSEGIEEGTPEHPRSALWSTRRSPNTITFLRGSIPAGY